MKRRNEKQNLKLIIGASAVGLTAVAVSLAGAYSSTMKRLTPTGGTSSGVYSFSAPKSSADADVPVNQNVSGIPKSSSKPTQSSSSQAEEANKPVSPNIGNIMPVEGEISHPFSNGELVKSETLGVWKTHDGCDILCDIGTDVKSMSEGVVKEIDNSTIWGVSVTVEQSNGLDVTYVGLAKELNVKAGSVVKQGEIIGKTGDTNQAELLQPPHLHLAVKQGGKWIDPVSVVTG